MLWLKVSAEKLMLLNVVLEKTLESPLDCKEIQPVHSKGDQPWDFFGRNDAKAETPVLWPPHEKIWLIGKDSDAGRDWGQEEKGTTEDEMAGWHHRPDGCESEWTPGVGDGQGGLACCGSWGHKESDTTERLKWTELMAKGVHGIGNKGKFFQLKVKPSHSPRPRAFFLDLSKTYFLPILPYLTPPWILSKHFTQVLIINANKKKAGYTPMLWVNPFLFVYFISYLM